MIVTIFNLSHSSNTRKNMEFLLDLFGSTHSSVPIMLVNLGLSTLVKRSKDYKRFLIFLKTANDDLFQSIFTPFISLVKDQKSIDKLISKDTEYSTIAKTEILELIPNNTKYKDDILSLIAATNSNHSSSSYNRCSICNHYKKPFPPRLTMTKNIYYKLTHELYSSLNDVFQKLYKIQTIMYKYMEVEK